MNTHYEITINNQTIRIWSYKTSCGIKWGWAAPDGSEGRDYETAEEAEQAASE